MSDEERDGPWGCPNCANGNNYRTFFPMRKANACAYTAPQRHNLDTFRVPPLLRIEA